MGARGPKSQHETNTVPLSVVPRQRIACPKHLPLIAREAWHEIVDSKPATHFQPSDRPLLEAYCLQYAIQRSTQAKINRALARGHDLEPAHIKILSVCAARLASLATKLRLSPNARMAIDAPVASERQPATTTQPVPAKRTGLMFEG
jgi:phage terminase small subunit